MRLILLIIGIIIIVAIVWDGIRRNRRLRQAQQRQRQQTLADAEQKLAQEKQKKTKKSEPKSVADDVQLSLFDTKPNDTTEATVAEKPDESHSTQQLADEFIEEEVEPVAQNLGAQSASESQSVELTPTVNNGVVSVYVMAKADDVFAGQKIVKALLAIGCCYGQHKAFHRHVRTDGRGPIYFSVVSAVKPGVFDINRMRDFTTIGLGFFMQLHDQQDADKVFALMLDGAKQVAELLDGQVCDSERQALTDEQLAGYRLSLASSNLT